MATWDPAKTNGSITLSGGNLIATGSLSAFRSTLDTLSHVTTGKYYWEISIGAANSAFDIIGIGNVSTDLGNFIGLDFNSLGWVRDGRTLINNTNILTIATWATADLLSVALDLGASKIWFRKNAGNWNNDVIANQNPATGVGGISTSTLNAGPYFTGYTADASGSQATANFGSSAFAQSVPSGFVAWDPLAIGSARAMLVG